MGRPEKVRDDEVSVQAAVPEDAETIAEIAALVNIHNYAEFDRGFLFYSLSSEEYRQRIREGHLCFLLKVGTEAVGFLFGVTKAVLQETLKKSFVYNNVYRFVEQHAVALDDYVFIDQMAILPGYQNQGLGEQFADRVLKAIGPLPIIADMLEYPLRNPRIRYFHDRGFVKIGEINEKPPTRFLETETDTVYDRLTWGIYLLRPEHFTRKRVVRATQ